MKTRFRVAQARSSLAFLYLATTTIGRGMLACATTFYFSLRLGFMFIWSMLGAIAMVAAIAALAMQAVFERAGTTHHE